MSRGAGAQTCRRRGAAGEDAGRASCAAGAGAGGGRACRCTASTSACSSTLTCPSMLSFSACGRAPPLKAGAGIQGF